MTEPLRQLEDSGKALRSERRAAGGSTSGISRLVAHIRALLPEDWFGRAGLKFRRTTERIDKFASEHGIKDLADEALFLGRRKLEGLANREFAATVKDFADAEKTRIDAELQRRSLQSKVKKDEEEARLTEIRRIDAELELLKKLKEVGAILRQDGNGNLTALPIARCDLNELAHQLPTVGNDPPTLEAPPPK